jgi:hypothetical protein
MTGAQRAAARNESGEKILSTAVFYSGGEKSTNFSKGEKGRIASQVTVMKRLENFRLGERKSVKWPF